LIAAPIIAIFLTTFIFQSYEVDGPSMETTLENHDRLIVLKVPKTIARLTNSHYIPNRNDIIIFKTSAIQDGSLDDGSEKQLVKRVIGLPGDRVVVKNGSSSSV
jgi:signal peptidase I